MNSCNQSWNTGELWHWFAPTPSEPVIAPTSKVEAAKLLLAASELLGKIVDGLHHVENGVSGKININTFSLLLSRMVQVPCLLGLANCLWLVIHLVLHTLHFLIGHIKFFWNIDTYKCNIWMWQMLGLSVWNWVPELLLTSIVRQKVLHNISALGPRNT